MMRTSFSTGQFVRRSLSHYARTHFAVALGVIVAAMVISGALIVGDSVRDSLQAISLTRMGAVDHALVTHRFFREASLAALSQQQEFQKRFETVAPALVFQASIERKSPTDSKLSSANSAPTKTRSAGVTLYGGDERLWSLLSTEGTKPPSEKGIVLNARLAQQLRAQVGEEVTIWVELPATIPRDSLLGGKEEQTTQEIKLSVEAILSESAGAGRFDLQPSQQFPKVAFVDLHALQKSLGLEEVERSRRNPTAKPARVNAMFVSARDRSDAQTEKAVEAAEALTRQLRDAITLEDFVLRLVPNVERGYLSLESERMILEDSLAEAAEQIAKKLNVASSPVLAYLVNLISLESDLKKFSKYSIVAGIPDPMTLPKPFGSVELLGEKLGDEAKAGLRADGVLISEWLAQDLGIRPEDLTAENAKRPKVRVSYHKVGSRGELPEEEKLFEVQGILPINGALAGDRGLTPHVPGITDAETFNDWDQPFPMKLPVTDRDEDYWDHYKATPKAFFNLDAAKSWWSSRYGAQTSLRLALPASDLAGDQTAAATQFSDRFARELLQSLKLETLGLGVQPTKWFGLRAASGTTDFAGLFIGFSFFMILSGLMLIALLVRLGIERRSSEVGLLAAIGFTPDRLRRLLFRESFSVTLTGGVIGTAAAVGYAGLLIYGLKTWWVGAVGTTLLALSVRPLTLVIGFVMTLIVSAGSAWWAMRGLRQLSPRALLAGQTELVELNATQATRRRRTSRIAVALLCVCVLTTLAVISGSVPAAEAFSGFSWPTVLFFVVGMSALVASLCAISVWLSGEQFAPVIGSGRVALLRLSLRNATRQRRRSLFSVALIASATFLLVAVAAGRRNPAVETPELNSGNGGFLFVAESTTPLLHDLNTAAGRVKLDLRQASGNSEQPIGKSTFDAMTVTAFRVQPGENASCLNLYQTRLPTILGVPSDLIRRGGFKFADTRHPQPWTLLDTEQADGSIPVLGDLNTLMYSLHKGIGKTIAVPDETQSRATLRIVGMLDSSIFQGVLLMSEANFLKLFPDQAGFRYFLIGDRRFEAGGTALSSYEARELSDRLETGLTPYGFDVEPIGDRLANFLAVQNTYLSTFQTLGGLGLLLGTIGLGTVMLRNVIERRSELALLRAVGFRPASIRWLVLLENAMLLALGLAAGTGSALLAMLPHLLSTGADAPWGSGFGLLVGIFAMGLLSALVSMTEAVRTPIVASLRGD